MANLDGMIKNRPVLFSVLYILGSVFLGPAIYLGGYLITPANGDYCDVAVHGSAARRDRDYAIVDNIQITGATAMLAVGLALMIWLWANHRRIGWPTLILTTAGILVMAAGYVLVCTAGAIGSTTTC